MQEELTNLDLVAGSNISLDRVGDQVSVNCTYTYDDTSLDERITDLEEEVSLRSLITETGNKVQIDLNTTNYKMKIKLYDKNDNLIHTSNEIDLPIEGLIVNVTYDSTTKELVITLQNGTTLRVPLSDIISGLVSQTDFDALEVRVDTAESDITNLQESQELQDAAIDNLDTKIDSTKEEIETQLEITQKELDLYKTIYNALQKVSGTGESLTLNETAESVMKNKLYPSEMSQEGTPSPEYPQTIHTITGDNTIEVAGKNLYNQTDLLNVQGWTKSNDYYTGGTYDLRVYWKNTKPIYSSFKENTQYTFSWTGYLGTATNVRIKFIYTDGTNTDNMAKLTSSEANVYGTSTLNKTIDHIEVDYGTSGTIFIKDIQLEESSTASTYEPYQSQSKPLNLGDLEYNAIGDYKDEFVKIDGKWYLRKNIGKIVLDGTQNVSNVNASSTNTSRVAMYASYNYVSSNILCDKLILNSGIWSQDVEGIYFARSGNDQTKGDLYFRINKSLIGTTIESYNAYVRQNNIIIYMPIVSTDIPLNETLQSQIEDLYNATMSYQGQTNISQVNNDLAFIVESSALKDNSAESDGE